MRTNSGRVLKRVWIAGILLAWGVQARGVYTPPQVQAMQSLQAASTIPLQSHFRAGFPTLVVMNVYRPGTDTDEVAAARGFLTQYAALYGLDRAEIQLTHVRTDDGPADRKLVRFAETYHGFSVAGAELIVHLRMAGTSALIFGTAGRLMLAATTGSAPPQVLDVDRVPAITSAMAEDAARSALGLPGAEVTGETALVVLDPGILELPGAPRLAWRVSIRRSRQVLIDANTSAILYLPDLVDESSGLDDYDMELEDMQESGSECDVTADGEAIGDEDGMDSDSLNDVDAVLAWFAARDVYLMFHDVFDRHSFDDDDGEVPTRVHATYDEGPNASGAAWCGVEFSTGWVARDVMGHEFGHMVIDETSDLAGDQPGSLNESFADIMGLMTDPMDWKIGETALAIGINGVRDFANPSPDRFSQFVVTPDPHVNANIINKAFYLMVVGGSFNGRDVEPMPFVRAGVLVFVTFLNLPQSASFIEARNLAVTFAQFLVDFGNAHGFTAEDVCTVRNAFRAVEIGIGDQDCNGVEDSTSDVDADGILDDGDDSGSNTDNPCVPASSIFSFQSWHCDDNCTTVPNPSQHDFDDDGDGDLCDLDDDSDGWTDFLDNCPGLPGNTPDSDDDGVYDCVDTDDDNDGVLDDGDGSGIEGDNPCPSKVTTNCDDNCGLPNPNQFDNNNNGIGEACDVDADFDGWYVLDDNCPLVSNNGQEDADSDGLGDACDLCPDTPDNANAYHPGVPELGIPPHPIQPDSDNDGLPDACDRFAFGQFSVFNQGLPYSAFQAMRPDNANRTIQISGPAGGGGRVRLTFPACETPSRLRSRERVDLKFFGMPATVNGWVEDDSGRQVGRIRPMNPLTRGLRFRPRCNRSYAVTLVTEAGFTGSASFSTRATVVNPAPGSPNPYASAAGQFTTPPLPLPDQDADGFYDAIDSCPTDYDPSGDDGDDDAVGDVCDNCPTLANPTQQPVQFPTVTAMNRQTFSWTGDYGYNWVSGSLAELQSGTPFANLGPGGTGEGHSFSLSAAEPFCSVTSCWYLWKHAEAGCGSWGSAERDAALPTFCNVYSDCSPGESCVDGKCVAPLLISRLCP